MSLPSALLRAIASILLLLLAACAGGPAGHSAHYQPAASHPTLILISIDGYRADYLARGHSPVLAALATDGVRAKWLQPSFPSLTFPNHYTLVTGQYPEHHGIIGNSMFDAELGSFSLSRTEAVQDGRWWDGAEPLWVTADKQGVTTATMFWPGSEARIHGYRPDYWLRYDGSVSATQRVDQVLAWLDLPAAERPGFITLYFDSVDHAGHARGPDSAEVDEALTHVDAALGRLLAGLRQRNLAERVNLVIVSDHGMAPVPAENSILMDQLIDMEAVYTVSMGVLAGFNFKRGRGAEVAKALLVDHPHMQCWRKGEFPERLHYGHHPRTPDISCLADVGWRISTSGYLSHRRFPLSRGQHGYDNANPLMRAIFVAHGPAFVRGTVLDGFANVDVYPLLARLLGVTPVDGDGRLVPLCPALRLAPCLESARQGLKQA